MTKVEALIEAKRLGFTKAVYVPYTYYPRKIDSHIREAKSTENSPDFKGSAEEATTWEIKEEFGTTYINGSNGDFYTL
jgi:hypothetical protein